MILRIASRQRPLASLADLADLIERPATGTPVLVAAVVDGNSGPHPGVLAAVLVSGRVAVVVARGRRSWRLITEPTNVYPLPDLEGR